MSARTQLAVGDSLVVRLRKRGPRGWAVATITHRIGDTSYGCVDRRRFNTRDAAARARRRSQ